MIRTNFIKCHDGWRNLNFVQRIYVIQMGDRFVIWMDLNEGETYLKKNFSLESKALDYLDHIMGVEGKEDYADW